MKSMKVAVIALVLVTVMGFAFSAGCLGDEEKKPSKKAPVISKGSMEPQEGWLNYNDQPKTFNISANGTALISMNITVSINDWDSAHAETDEGSEPDTIQIDVKSVDGAWSFSEKLTTDPSTGAASAVISIPNENITVGEDEKLPTEWTITISGVQFGGGKNPTGPAGIIPIPFLVYIDQGCAYSISAEYEYEE